VGGYIFDDRHGLVGRSGVQLTYAYHIRIEDAQLSFGLSGTFWQFRIDRQNARLFDPDDDLFNTMDNGMFIPDANVGMYYSSARYYIGISADQLFQSSLKFGGLGYEQYKLHRHFYLMGGYNFQVTNDVILEPSLLIKSSRFKSFQLDLTAKAYFYENYWGGISFRTGSALIFMGGVKVDKFYFGYAFDYSFTSIMSHSYGTHEIMIAMKFGETARRFRWLQRF
jgi:type IX secretion system PorP/SprF family membrane protein